MTTSHTPGPWIGRRGTIGTTRYHIAEMMPSGAPDMPPGFAPESEQEANARLIAAAPKLLEILDRILYAHETGNCGASMGEAFLCRSYALQAREAVDEAKGRS